MTGVSDQRGGVLILSSSYARGEATHFFSLLKLWFVICGIGNEEATTTHEFRILLDAYFKTLPASYGLSINLEKVEDVLLHRKLLLEAKDSPTKCIFVVRPSEVPLHELMFSTVDRPKLVSQISAMISEMGLIFREAHAYSTTDGFALYIFVVDGWQKDTMALYKEVEKGLDKIEVPLSGSPHSKSLIERALANAAQPDNVQIDGELLRIGKQIASGSSGDIHLGMYLDQRVAVKVLRSENLTKASEDFDRELAVLREVRHQNVIRLIGWCTKRAQRCLVTEYMRLGSLYDFLREKHCILTLPQIVKFALDISEGMEYLHERNIIHRDLKSANLLLDSQNVVKVADFGIARFVNQGDVLTAEKGTYKWMAPEILNHEPYDQRADVYSFGIILWELMTGKVPYDTMTPLQAAMEVRQGARPELPIGIHPMLLLMMVRCWQLDPDVRPSFADLKVELQRLLQEIQASIAMQAADVTGRTK